MAFIQEILSITTPNVSIALSIVAAYQLYAGDACNEIMNSRVKCKFYEAMQQSRL